MKFKKFSLKTIISFLSCLIFIPLSFCSCSSEDENSKLSSLIDSRSKSYYSRTGYVSIEVSDSLTFTCSDLVAFDDNTYMVTSNSSIELFYNNTQITSSNFLQNTYQFTELSEGKILSSLNINDKIINLSDLEDEDLIITENTTISANFKSISPIGLCIDYSNVDDEDYTELKLSLTDNNEVISNHSENILLILSNSTDEFKNLTANDFSGNTTFFLTKNGNNFSFIAESPELILNCYLVFIDDEDNLYTIKLLYDEDSGIYKINNLDYFGIGEISLELFLDLTTISD